MGKSLNVSSVATASDGNKIKEVNKKLSRYKDTVELWKGFEIEPSADLGSHWRIPLFSCSLHTRE